MSIDLISAARTRLDVSHGELLVAVELCDAANDYGEGISVGVPRIADRSRQDVRTVQRQLKRLREVGWLEVVEAGGMVGGRGKATLYRINPAWVRGDTLPGFPDFVPKFYTRDRGGSLSPLPEKGCQTDHERVTKQGVKGDTAASPDPSTHIPADARARANPTGSRAAQEPEPKKRKSSDEDEPAPFDEPASRGYWWNHIRSAVVGQAIGLERAKFGSQTLDHLSTYDRSHFEPVARELFAWAVDEDRAAWPNQHRERKRIEGEISSRVTREWKTITTGAQAA